MNNEIEDLLYAAITATAVGLALALKYPNMAAPSDGAYIEIIHIPNGVAIGQLSEDNNAQGIIRLIYHAATDDVGQGAIAANTILAIFAVDIGFGVRFIGTNWTVEIYRPPEYLGLVEDGQETTFPLSIRYRAFKK